MIELMAAHTHVVRKALAAASGCDPSSFETHSLAIVAAPGAGVDGGALAIAKTMGTGTVLSVEPGFEDWARANAPRIHHHAMQPSFLGRLAAEMAATGLVAHVYGASLGFTLGELPGPLEVPPGFRIEERGRDWMTSDPVLVKEFDNALEGDQAHPLPLAALVLESENRRPAAVAGIWDHWDHGEEIYEIGIDVARDFRGQGLATVITNASSRWILKRRRVPIYTCEVSNLRSQRVAASCGFLPIWAWAGVRRDTQPSISVMQLPED